MKKILTIAGSDCSGGAGIQADIKTITAHKMYAMSAVTALTAQNTTGVFGIHEIEPTFLSQQLDCIFNDIRPDAVKVGMVSSSRIIEVIAERLIHYEAKNIVIDPVMVATSGGRLLTDGSVNTLREKLIPIGTVITPNIPEAEILSGIKIENDEDMVLAAVGISSFTDSAILIKGGHLTDSADDFLYKDKRIKMYKGTKIHTNNTHGTGCTLSSAIACGLAEGYSIEESVQRAKDYVWGAIAAGLNIGRGNGPLDHMFELSIGKA